MGDQTLPLCSRYLLVLFVDQPMQVAEDGVMRDQVIRWALGVLDDGLCEVLGVWPKPASGVMG